MKLVVKSLIGLMLLSSGMRDATAQPSNEKERLTVQQVSLVRIAALTAQGDLTNLNNVLNDGLNAGMTVNEIKEALVHVYAYCGFPRSIRGLQTFMEVLKDREAKGIKDTPGREASPIHDDGNKYERGKKILSELTQAPQNSALTGYNAFAPVIDTFLKEHLFADVFERDVLTYAQRELVTISVLSAIGGVEPMLRSHLSICLNVGITSQQLKHFVTVLEPAIGREKTESARLVLHEVLQTRPRN